MFTIFPNKDWSKRIDEHFDRVLDNMIEEFPSFGNSKYSYFKSVKSSDENIKVEENNDAQVLYVAVPGHTSESISVEINGDTLSVKAEHIEDDPFSEELDYSFKVPSYLDKTTIDATVKKGVLAISFQVKKKEEKPTIKVKVK